MNSAEIHLNSVSLPSRQINISFAVLVKKRTSDNPQTSLTKKSCSLHTFFANFVQFHLFTCKY